MSTATDTPTLGELIRAELEDTVEPDPHVIASRLAETLPESIVRACLASLIVPLVRGQICDTRARLRRGRGKWKTGSDRYAAFLQQREFISTDGEWKMLGDCTLADVMAIVDMREAQAAASLEVAEHYRRLAKAMDEADVQLVSDLPEDVVVGMLSDD